MSMVKLLHLCLNKLEIVVSILPIASDRYWHGLILVPWNSAEWHSVERHTAEWHWTEWLLWMPLLFRQIAYRSHLFCSNNICSKRLLSSRLLLEDSFVRIDFVSRNFCISYVPIHLFSNILLLLWKFVLTNFCLSENLF